MAKHIMILINALAALIFCAHVKGQSIEDNEISRGALDKMFEYLDKSKVPTGLLYDYSVNLVDFDQFDGTEVNDSNYVDIGVFEDMLRSIRSAAVRHMTFDNVDDVMNSFQQTTNNNINLGLIFYNYNFIREDALKKKLITYSNGQVYDKYMSNGEWINPYSDSYLIGVSPSINTCKVGTVIYNIKPFFTFTNISNNDISIKFDPGDGRGERDLLNLGLKAIPVTYSTPGIKELRFKFSINGKTFNSHSYMLVDNLKIKQQSDISVQDTLVISTDYNGKTVTAKVSFSFADEGALKKPFIIAEGFDPWELLEFTQYPVDNDGFTTIKGNTSAQWAYSHFKNNYDLVYIDWYNSTEDIRANSKLLIDIIQRINQIKSNNGSKEKNILMGQSMGGLIARHALCEMEKNGQAHEVSTFISHDTPHLGANIPLGILYLTHQAFCLMNGYSGIVDLAGKFSGNDISRQSQLIWNVLHSPAAKQMLINYVGTDGILDNSVHDDWQHSLLQRGFPKGDKGSYIENLCIVNGGTPTSPTPNDYVSFSGHFKTRFWGNVLLFFLPILVEDIRDYDFMKISPYIPGSSILYINTACYPYISSNCLLSNITITYTKKFLWLFPKKYNIFNAQAYAPSNSSKFYDGYRSSYYSVPLDSLEFNIPNNIINGDYKFHLVDNIPFIPVTSALNISDELKPSTTSRNYYINPPKPLVESPFNAYYLTDTTQGHIEISANTFNWIKKQIDMTLSGNTWASDGDLYSITGVSEPITWSSSNTDIATIDNSGKLKIHSDGMVTITAESYNYGQKIFKSKKILTGFIPLVISDLEDSNDGFLATVSCVNSDHEELLNELITNGTLKYEWGIKVGENDIEWSTSNLNELKIGIPETTNTTTIFVRLVSSDGRRGTTYSKSYKMYNLFIPNYRAAAIDRFKFISRVPNPDFRPKDPSSQDLSLYVLDISREATFDYNHIFLTRQPHLLSIDGTVEISKSTEYNGTYYDLFNSEFFRSHLEPAYNSFLEGNLIYDLNLKVTDGSKTIQIIPFAIFNNIK